MTDHGQPDFHSVTLIRTPCTTKSIACQVIVNTLITDESTDPTSYSIHFMEKELENSIDCTLAVLQDLIHTYQHVHVEQSNW